MLDLLAGSPTAFIAVALVLGLIVGSFLNVVIYRLPIMLERQWRSDCAELAAPPTADAPVAPVAPPVQTPAFNLAVPRSICPACRAPIKSLHNIPVLSYLALRGRCAHCKIRISARYPAVELLCGVATALVAWRFGFGASAVCAATRRPISTASASAPQKMASRASSASPANAASRAGSRCPTTSRDG